METGDSITGTNASIPLDFEGYVAPKRKGSLNLFGEWMALSKPVIPPGYATVTYVVNSEGKAEILSSRSGDGNRARDEVLARAIVSSRYEPAYITQDYIQNGLIISANSKVISREITKTVFWYSPDTSSPDADRHWICNQQTQECGWHLKVVEQAPEPSVKSTPVGWDRVHSEPKKSTSTKKKRSGLVPALIVGGFAGWYVSGKI